MLWFIAKSHEPLIVIVSVKESDYIIHFLYMSHDDAINII